jgi:hypothetical protein
MVKEPACSVELEVRYIPCPPEKMMALRAGFVRLLKLMNLQEVTDALISVDCDRDDLGRIPALLPLADVVEG